jgi:hypothetical protein
MGVDFGTEAAPARAKASANLVGMAVLCLALGGCASTGEYLLAEGGSSGGGGASDSYGEAPQQCNVFECLQACREGGESAAKFYHNNFPPKVRYICSGISFVGETVCRGYRYRFCTPGWK